jgi:TolA-binding protein
MQPDQMQTAILFKFWPWFEANIKKIIAGTAIAAIAVFVIGFYAWQQNQKQIAAGKALTRAMISLRGDLTDAYLKVAADYPGTGAGARALLQAAATLFAQDKYADAQTQFQHFLDIYPDNSFATQASLGVAACLDAQGKTDAAVGAYKNVVNQTSDENALAQAKFSLARIYDSQGKAADARELYQDVMQANPYSSLGEEASVRVEELKLPTKPAPETPAKPDNLLLITTNMSNQH